MPRDETEREEGGELQEEGTYHGPKRERKDVEASVSLPPYLIARSSYRQGSPRHLPTNLPALIQVTELSVWSNALQRHSSSQAQGQGLGGHCTVAQAHLRARSSGLRDSQCDPVLHMLL